MPRLRSDEFLGVASTALAMSRKQRDTLEEALRRKRVAEDAAKNGTPAEEIPAGGAK